MWALATDGTYSNLGPNAPAASSSQSPSAYDCIHRGLQGATVTLWFWGDEINFKTCHDNDNNIGKSYHSLRAYSVLGCEEAVYIFHSNKIFPTV